MPQECKTTQHLMVLAPTGPRSLQVPLPGMHFSAAQAPLAALRMMFTITKSKARATGTASTTMKAQAFKVLFLVRLEAEAEDRVRSQ